MPERELTAEDCEAILAHECDEPRGLESSDLYDDRPPTTEPASEGNLEMDAGAGASDYSHSLTFTSSKFIVTAFGHDREHCEDVLQCVLRGRFADHEGDKEFGRL